MALPYNIVNSYPLAIILRRIDGNFKSMVPVCCPTLVQRVKSPIRKVSLLSLPLLMKSTGNVEAHEGA